MEQYHIGSLLLCLSHKLENKNPDNLQEDLINRSFRFIEKGLSKPGGQNNADFTFESICLAHHYCKSEKYRILLEEFIKKNIFFLKDKIKANAVDYFLLRYFNTLYIKKNFGIYIELNKDVNDVLKSIMNSSGILPDSYIKEGGVPDLTYHCRNLQILCSCYRIGKQNSLLPLIEKSFHFTKKIMSPNGRVCFYGRTPDLIYGNVSLLNAISLFYGNKSLPEWRKLFNYFNTSFINKESFNLSISPFSFINDKNRLGFDCYVYPIIYKWFTLAKLFCSNNEIINYKPNTHSSIYVHKNNFDAESGFLIFRNNNKQITINLLGHPEAPIRKFDRRYLPLVPCLHASDNCFTIIPYESIIKYPNDNFFIKLTRKYYDFKLKKKYLKSNVGFLSFFTYKEFNFIPAQLKILNNENNIVSLKVIKYYKVTGNKEVLINSCETDLHTFIYVNFDSEYKIYYKFNKDITFNYNYNIYENSNHIITNNELILDNYIKIKFNQTINPKYKNLVSFETALGILKVNRFKTKTKINSIMLKYNYDS